MICQLAPCVSPLRRLILQAVLQLYCTFYFLQMDFLRTDICKNRGQRWSEKKSKEAKKKVSMINLVSGAPPLSTTLATSNPPCIAHSWDWALLVCSAFGGDSQLHGCQRYRVTSRLSTSLPVFWHLKTHPAPYLFFIPFKILPHLIFLHC